MCNTMNVLPSLALLLALSFAQPAWGEDEHDDNTETLSALVGLLKDSDDPQFHLDILKGISEALKGRTNVKMPEGWTAVSAQLGKSSSEEVRHLVQSLSTLFGDPATMNALTETVQDKAAPAADRQRALQALYEAKAPGLLPVLKELLGDEAVRQRAVRYLASYEDPQTPALVLKHYKALSAPERLDALNTLASREIYALALLDALKSGAIDKKDLSAATVRQLSDYNNEQFNQWIASNWGAVRTTPEDKLVEMAKYKELVNSAKPEQFDASRGRAVFVKTCAQCHMLFGEGGKVGPDLTGSGRAELDYILTNVVDPNAVIGKDYQVSIVRTHKKRIITGIVTRDDEQLLTVQTETEAVTLPKSEIARVRVSDTSMMPEGLLQMVTEQEALDLIAYLRSPGQVPLPDGATAATPAPAAAGQ
jgi:putative heme-binding domain-containing protein